MDHRVEPPAWLPQGAAPEAADPAAEDSPAAEDVQQAEDSNAAPADAAAEEFANGNGNGHDNSFSYSRDDSYHYGGDASFGEGTSYRSPFTPHAPAGTSYEQEEPAPAENGLPGSDPAGGDDAPETGQAGRDLPASGIPGSGTAASGPPGSDLPASGLDDPAMPEHGLPRRGSRLPRRARLHRHGHGPLQRPCGAVPGRRAVGGRGGRATPRSMTRAARPAISARRSGLPPR